MHLAAASGVSRASNRDIPLIGTCIRAFQNIYVERAGEGARKKKKSPGGAKGGRQNSFGICSEGLGRRRRRQRRRSDHLLLLLLLLRRVTAAIQARVEGDPDWPNLILAPEGTCGDGKCLLRFRTGAFVPGAPVLPILLKYEGRRFNPAWGIVADERIHFVRALCQFRKRVDVLVLPATSQTRKRRKRGAVCEQRPANSAPRSSGGSA